MCELEDTELPNIVDVIEVVSVSVYKVVDDVSTVIVVVVPVYGVEVVLEPVNSWVDTSVSSVI